MTDTVVTLPADTSGAYETTRFNALRHGVLSRYTILPWEDEGEYQSLLDALVEEHAPHGPTEEHLVEELAGVIWRKRRLRLAEAAAHQHGLTDSTESLRDNAKAAMVHVQPGRQEWSVGDAIRATPKKSSEELADLEEDEAMTEKALKLLGGIYPDAYKKAIASLQDDTREWWEDLLTWEPDDFDEGEEPATPDAEGLLRFLEGKVLPWYASRRKELEYQPLIRMQAIGESLDPDKLGRLARYEVHLDRKLERMLAMLIRLQDLRRETSPG